MRRVSRGIGHEKPYRATLKEQVATRCSETRRNVAAAQGSFAEVDRPGPLSFDYVIRLPCEPPRHFFVGFSGLAHKTFGFGIPKALGFDPRFLGAVSQFSGNREQLKIWHWQTLPAINAGRDITTDPSRR
jgi:hypothetical protein